MSPTIGIINPTVVKGGTLSVVGYAMPGYILSLSINGKIINSNATADVNGYYRFNVNTSDLSYGSYVVKVSEIDNKSVKSDDSVGILFTVAQTLPAQTNTGVNGTGISNLSNWSTFLFDYSSTDPNIKKRADLNGDGKVDATDLGIFLRSIKP